MPALWSTSLLHTLVSRSANATAIATNITGHEVVCAFPVSGQYGPGSRALYYALVIACLLARKAEWLRNACLAAALLFPAVAALHGIVLASVHIDGAVDMDIYGAFQLCSIGVLAAPVTVRLSRTYFYDPGRNIIFIWTVLLLSGLLSLTVEFYRTQTSPCTHDDYGNPIPPAARNFPFGNAACGLICSVPEGPFSPMRQNAANNIYVIPTPDHLTFDTATLIAAACCIPAILSLVFMWNKILEINWKNRFGNRQEEEEQLHVPIEGTNGATNEKMRRVNNAISTFMSTVEVPVFGGAVLGILILGEWNFFSPQVVYQTEPIVSIGQWAPIVGTALAILGSLYLLAAKMQEEESPKSSIHKCTCSMHELRPGLLASSSYPAAPPDATDIHHSLSHGEGTTPSGPAPVTRPSGAGEDQQLTRSWTLADIGNRRKIASTLIAIGNHLGTAAHDRFDVSDFKHGKANDFPEIPGETYRNRDLTRIKEQYNQSRDEDGNVTPGLRRVGSFNGSIASGRGVLGSAATSRAPSPSPARPHAATLPAERISFDLQPLPSGRTARRRDTLEVPSRIHLSPTPNSPSAASVFTVPQGQSSPAIVVSSDTEMASPAETPDPDPYGPPWP